MIGWRCFPYPEMNYPDYETAVFHCQQLTNAKQTATSEILSETGKQPVVARRKITWLSEDAFEQMPLHARKSTRYYRNILPESDNFGMLDVDMKPWQELPLLTQEILQSSFEELCRAKLPDWHKGSWVPACAGMAKSTVMVFEHLTLTLSLRERELDCLATS